MINCYIVDDEAHAIQVLERYIRQTPGLELVGSADNPLLALEAITSGGIAPEIVFSDVDMPQLSGVQLAELIAPYTKVIFTTAYPNFALEAFDKNAVDYLLKPILYERFLKSINKVREGKLPYPAAPRARESEGYFFVKSDIKGKVVRVNPENILYVEALQNYVRIHLSEGAIITYLTMKEMEEYLPFPDFSRVHKSFIVQNNKVIAVEGNQVVLEDNTALPLGITYRENFLQDIHARLLKSRRLP